jgi:hypothetical protein
MQNISYRSKGTAAYLTSTVIGENAKRVMDIFNSATMATGTSAFSAPGIPGMPPGMGGGPPRGP